MRTQLRVTKYDPARRDVRDGTSMGLLVDVDFVSPYHGDPDEV